MRPRVHATFELFTLGFVVTLDGNEKEIIRLIVLERKNNVSPPFLEYSFCWEWNFLRKIFVDILELGAISFIIFR